MLWLLGKVVAHLPHPIINESLLCNIEASSEVRGSVLGLDCGSSYKELSVDISMAYYSVLGHRSLVLRFKSQPLSMCEGGVMFHFF